MSFLRLQEGGALLLQEGGHLELQGHAPEPEPDAQEPVGFGGHAFIWPETLARPRAEIEAEELAVILSLLAARGPAAGPK